MQLLSLISFGVFICYMILAYNCFRLGIARQSVWAAFLTTIHLGIWAFAMSLYYLAPDAETAWFWHRFSAIGWAAFPAASSYYYLLITDRLKKMPNYAVYLLFYAVPCLLLIMNWTGSTTAVATDLRAASVGTGFAYVNDIYSWKLWIYIITFFLYFGAGFLSIIFWSRKNNNPQMSKRIYTILILFCTVFLFGGFTDLILPLFGAFIPPIAVLFLPFALIGNMLETERLKFFSLPLGDRSHLIFDTISEGILMLDLNGKIVHCNLEAARILKIDREQIIDKHIFNFVNDKAAAINFFRLLQTEKKTKNIETFFVTASKEKIEVIFSAALAEKDRFGHLGVVMSFHDISERKNLIRDLQEERKKYSKLANDYYKLANYDALTKLPNRRLLHEMATKINKKDFEWALLFCDLDGFKSINDRYGHDIGDRILQLAAARLENCLTHDDLIARLGGDEFVLVVRGDKKTAQNRAASIKSSFDQPFVFDGKSFELGISVGYTLSTDCDDPKNWSLSQMLHLADKSMYSDKKSRKKL